MADGHSRIFHYDARGNVTILTTLSIITPVHRMDAAIKKIPTEMELRFGPSYSKRDFLSTRGFAFTKKKGTKSGSFSFFTNILNNHTYTLIHEVFKS